MWTEFFAGLGFFLFGMHRLEFAIRELAGRSFKRLLRRFTDNKWQAILNGTFATAVLQSSTLVILMVLAFVGAGIIELKNALGMILGANLGTTFTGWVVASLGFKANLGSLALPLIAIGCCGIVLLGSRFRFYHWMSLIASFGFLLLGLNHMRDSLSHWATPDQVEFMKGQSIFSFLLFGFILTAIIQSSSAMMTLTLSALSVGLFDLTSGAAVIIGADLGTTLTAAFTSLRGSPLKKRVAAAHFIFNLVSAGLALIALKPILWLIQNLAKVQDPLFTLVAFHSSFNFLSILIFAPFLERFEIFLRSLFARESNGRCHFISRVGFDVPEASLAAVHRELEAVTLRVFDFNRHLLGLLKDVDNHRESSTPFLRLFIKEEDTLHAYESLKVMESEILNYLSGVQRQPLEATESSVVQNQVLALRYSMQSAKALKDILHNLIEFSTMGGRHAEEYEGILKKHYEGIFREMNELWIYSETSVILEHLDLVTKMNDSAFAHVNEWIYSDVQSTGETESLLTNFLNVNKEIHSSCRYLILAMRELHQG